MKANKRILCIILALVMCLSTALISVSAENSEDAANQQYKDIVFEALGSYVNPKYQFYRCEYAYNADGSTPDEGEIPDYILAWSSAEAVHCTVTELVIGDYYFYLPHACFPYDLGYFICSTKENKCYSLEEAWYLQLPEIEKVLAMVGTPTKETNNHLTRFRAEVISLMGWEDVTEEIEYRVVLEYNKDGKIAEAEGATPDYAVIFAHTGGILCWEVYEYFGNYKMKVPAVYNPGYMIYSIEENKLYSIREAYNQEFPGMDLVLEYVGRKEYLYRDVFEEYLKPYASEELINSVEGWFAYDELYYYGNQQQHGTTEMGRLNPDYVLIYATAYYPPPANVTEMFGDYVVYSGWGIPKALSYYVYTPKDNKIYTLREAYDAKLEGIMNIFTDYGLGFMLGDMDSDQRLTIKDATYIQKCLAKMEGFTLSGKDKSIPDWVHIDIADVNLDYKTNIKDATAIQKKLAKIAD